jgi:hypothetical protein
VPTRRNTFFSTKEGSGAFMFQDRGIFINDDVFAVLKSAKIKGPHCERLWTDEEWKKHFDEKEAGRKWLPKGRTVFLAGK